MSIDLRWEEPPAASSRDASAVGIAVETLKKHPGKWAKVEEGSTSTTAAAKWRKRGCEAVHRSRAIEAGDGKGRKKAYVYDVYARWPEPEPEPPTPEEVARQKARTATPQELAKAYAEKHGAALAPGRKSSAAEEVDHAWRDRLGHGHGSPK